MIFGTWVAVVVFTMSIGECLNCIYPRVEDFYNSEGLICQWEESDFTYDAEIGYTLKDTDSTDNCIESKVRKFKKN
tara:strand:+ start:724 stop:951 length:228 start_codon:yes stop_codon:yes gene_type:complete